MHKVSNNSSKCALWFASLLMVACAGGMPEPESAPTALGAPAQAIRSPTVACASDGHCPSGQSCDADGMCRPRRACHTSYDCHKGQVCDPATSLCVPRPRPACSTDADCASGGVCDPATGTCEAGPCTRQADGTCK